MKTPSWRPRRTSEKRAGGAGQQRRAMRQQHLRRTTAAAKAKDRPERPQELKDLRRQRQHNNASAIDPLRVVDAEWPIVSAIQVSSPAAASDPLLLSAGLVPRPGDAGVMTLPSIVIPPYHFVEHDLFEKPLPTFPIML